MNEKFLIHSISPLFLKLYVDDNEKKVLVQVSSE